MGQAKSKIKEMKKKREKIPEMEPDPAEMAPPKEEGHPFLNQIPNNVLSPVVRSTSNDSGHASEYTPASRSSNINSGKSIVIALFDFQPSVDKELGFRAGDHMLVLKVEDPEWIFAQHQVSGRMGYIPSSYVADATTLDAYEWYHGSIERRDAESLLWREPIGNFLVRDSLRNPGNFALSVKWFNDSKLPLIKHFVINYIDYQFSIWKLKYFDNLNDLIQEYRDPKAGLPIQLINPCPKPVPTLTDLSVDTKDEWEIDRSEITITENIGSGHFGEVFKGNWKGTLEVAIKTLKKGTMSDEKFLEEAKIMKGLKHDNILNLLATCSKDEPIFIITKFMSLGSLQSLLRKSKHSQEIQFDEMLKFAHQIAKGMSYLEEKKLIHRDLAARNVLVDRGYICKIADFGLAKMIEEHPSSQSNDKFPVKWSPPEVLISGHFNTKSDVWSYGIVLIEIITYGDDIYKEFKSKGEIKHAVLNGFRIPKPDLCPDYTYEVILKCWDANPYGRPTFNDLKVYFEDSSSKVIDGTQYLLKPTY